MNAKNFVNFHILISHSPSCLNRDDMNMQKTAVFGGATRVRISSQSLKRAMRKSEYYAANLGEPSVRTRDLEKVTQLFVGQLKGEFEASLIAETMALFVRESGANEENGAAEEPGGDSGAGEERKLAVAPWALDEIRALCRIVGDISLTGEELEKAKEKTVKQKGKKKKPEHEVIAGELAKKRKKAVSEKIGEVRAAMASTLDIALSGRMATSGLMTSVDGALAVAHALTTHAVEPQDVDWFTAVDDLTQGAGETGAGHLDTQQFSAGVFYRYASLNLKQLQVNLGLLENISSPETPESRKRALDVAKHALHLLATVVPSAKQQSFAAHNLAELALVSFADQPISLANGFEKPIERARGGGYLAPSEKVLVDYWARLNTAYGLDEKAGAFHMDGLPLPVGLAAFEKLSDLETWIQGDGKPKE